MSQNNPDPDGVNDWSPTTPGDWSVDQFVDGLSVRWGALATSLIGIVFYGGIEGLVGLINLIMGGTVAAIDRLASGLAAGVTAITSEPATALDVAIDEAAAFIGLFGTGAPVVGVILGMITVFAAVWLSQSILRWVM